MPLAIISVVIAIVAGIIGFSGTGLFGGGRGPVATGPGRGAEVSNPQPVSGGVGIGRPAPPPAPKPGESPLKGKVSISSVQRSGDRPEAEYVIIRYGGLFGGSDQDRPVDLTGWQIGSTRSSQPLPRAFNIPEIDATEQDIYLAPGGELIIVTGTPSYAKNFRENACLGYLNQTHAFTPSLSNSCIDASPDRADLLRRGFNGACVDAIRAVPTCRTPQGPFQAAIIKSECIDYMNQNFSYAGCVKNFRDRKEFLKPAWRVSLRLPSKLFDVRHDRVVLRDRQGLLVDEFEY